MRTRDEVAASQLEGWDVAPNDLGRVKRGCTKPTSQSGTFVLGPEAARRSQEHARFAELHRGLISSLLRVTGGEQGVCYCGDYLTSGWLVGSVFDGRDLTTMDPLDAELFRESDGDFGLEPLVSSWQDSPLAGRAGWQPSEPQPGQGRIAWLPLVVGVQLVGVVAALVAEARCSAAVLAELGSLSLHCCSFADIFLQHQELNRWLDVTNHLASFDGVCAVVDAKCGELLWVGARGDYAELQQEARESAAAIVNVVARSASHLESDPPVSYPILSNGTVVHVQEEKTLSTFGGQRLAVVAIRPHRVENNDDVTTVLSRREHQVARLLADGYTIVNAAAILDLTENTVRTYVRRLYRKLGVNTRTDLVRQLQAQLA